MMFHNAICRRPGPDFAGGLTTARLGAPDFEKALAQHAAYVAALRDLGLKVQVLDALPGHPDACFVEDPAVVTPELAVLTNPGAESRKGEVATIDAALASHRDRVRIVSPGALDGGDVLIVGRTVHVGISQRTNSEGARQLAEALSPHGYEIVPVPVGEGLHLKSSVNGLGDDWLLISPDFEERPVFEAYRKIVVDPAETYACNTLWINDTLITPTGFPLTRKALDRAGLPVIELELSEFEKMDGGLTCLSLRF